ncbi:unnamed protein product [Brassica oleracea var. botrytis]|uniref:(rape) hypothetical protein n=1 Tax=Brassica napus TaxID=3708 RepID=A0A816V0L5_BRANA|nr:unnamed protein product [Brassica napus]
MALGVMSAASCWPAICNVGSVGFAALVRLDVFVPTITMCISLRIFIGVFFCNSSSLALIDGSRNHSETGVRVLIYRIEQETNKLTFIYHLNMKMCILLNLNRDRMKINGI